MPSPWITRMVADLEVTTETDAQGVVHVRDFDSTKVPFPTRCQTITCRVRQDRQDLQCTKRAGHTGRHYRSIALGFCSPRFAHLDGPGSGGRRGGHRNPVIG